MTGPLREYNMDGAQKLAYYRQLKKERNLAWNKKYCEQHKLDLSKKKRKAKSAEKKAQADKRDTKFEAQRGRPSKKQVANEEKKRKRSEK